MPPLKPRKGHYDRQRMIWVPDEPVRKAKAPARPTRSDKEATVWAAEQNLHPWEVRTTRPKPPGKQVQPGKAESLEHRYRVAKAAPVSRQARQRLADTMSDERKHEYVNSYKPTRPPPPSYKDYRHHPGLLERGGSFLAHGGLGSALGHAAGAVGRGALEGPEAVANMLQTGSRGTAAGARALSRAPSGFEIAPKVPGYTEMLGRDLLKNVQEAHRAQRDGGRDGFLGALTETPRSIKATLGGVEKSKAGGAAEDTLVGRNLVRFATGRSYDPKWALIDAAALIPGLKIGRFGKALFESSRAMEGLTGPAAQKAARDAFAHVMEGPSLTSQAITAAKRAPVVRGPERAAVHDLINKGADSPLVAKTVKDMLDAHVHQVTRGLKGQERKTAAQAVYKAVRDTFPEGDLGVSGLKNFRDARWQATLDPHYAEDLHVPTPLNEGELAAHVDQSIADAAKIKNVERNPAKLTEILRNAKALAEEGAAFREWYEFSAKRIMEHVHGDVGEADKLAQLFGIYSANRTVDMNSIAALRAYDQAKAGQKITEGSRSQIKKAEAVMRGEDWAGRKTNTFYANMLKHIDPEKYAADPELAAKKVTVDVWMMRALGLARKVPTNAQYTWVENHISEIARQLGWSPEEAQAAIWVALKAKSEKSTLERAAFDFAHGIDTHLGQMHLGPVPPEVMQVIAPNGRSLINEIVGVPGVGGFGGTDGVGAFIPLIRTSGRGGDYVISPAERELARQASAAHGMVLDLDEVSYGRIFQSKTLKDSNAVNLPLGKSLSSDLTASLKAALPKGTDIVHTGQGAWLINRTKGKAKLANRPWIKEVEKALRSVDPELDRKGIAVAFDGGKVTRSQYDNQIARLERRRPGAGEALRGLADDARWAAREGGAAPAGGAGDTLGQVMHETGGPRPLEGGHPQEGMGARFGPEVTGPPSEGEPFLSTPELAAGGRTPQEAVRAGIPQAKATRRAMERKWSPERAKRTAKSREEFNELRRQGFSATEAEEISRGQLAGELPKFGFGGFDELSLDAQNELTDDIFAFFGKEREYDARKAAKGLREAREQGITPQMGQIALLEEVFPKPVVDKIAAAAEEQHSKIWREILNMGNVPRAMQSAFDLSGMLRQALTVAARHPGIWKEGIAPSVRGGISKQTHERLMKELMDNPGFHASEDAGVHYTQVGEKAKRREESYQSTVAERIPGVGASARAYSLFLNELRLKMWNHLVEQTEKEALKAAGKKPLKVGGKRITRSRGLTEEEALKKAHKDLARYINSMTGRGPFPGKFGGAADLLNMAFFSPRLMASRFDLLLSPLTYYHATPYVRKQAMRSMMQTVTIGLALLAAVDKLVPGVTIEWDPRHTDFARIKIGNTRIDPWGGFQPQVRLLARLATGKFIGSSGKAWDLGTGGFGQSTRWDIILDYLRSKASPNASFFIDMADNQNMVGDKFQWIDQWQRLMPLLAGDVWQSLQNGDTSMSFENTLRSRGEYPRALGVFLAGQLGIGAQTYQSGRPKSGSSSGGGLSGGLGGLSGGLGP